VDCHQRDRDATGMYHLTRLAAIPRAEAEAKAAGLLEDVVEEEIEEEVVD
jgi:hypothetical protein